MGRTSLRRRFAPAAMVAAVSAACIATVLVGCVAEEPAPSPVATLPSPTTEPSASPTVLPDGSAEDNRAYFDSVNSAFLAPAPMPGGRPIIDNLVAVGFDRAAMQVTPDQTAIGGAVDSVQFSVRFGDDCLIGQTSAASGYISTVGPTVDGTSCLAGATRPIDW